MQLMLWQNLTQSNLTELRRNQMTALHQILLVEDDPLIARSLVMSLRYEGFSLTVAASAVEAELALVTHGFDLVVLDVGLPDGNGIALCRQLREREPDLPILMLSARSEEASVVDAINGGADDYVRKPCGVRELSVRMRRLLGPARRSRSVASFGPLHLDLHRRTAEVGGRTLQLGKKEYDILALLVHARGDAVTREQILDGVDHSHAVYDRTIDSHLSHLRAKLRECGAALRIVAIYGVGYRMEHG